MCLEPKDYADRSSNPLKVFFFVCFGFFVFSMPIGLIRSFPLINLSWNEQVLLYLDDRCASYMHG